MNQELLDYLATHFIAQGGSIKTLVREIALSATYRQASVTSPKMVALDPANQLLGRMNRRRLTVEQWRDTLLYQSGELVPEGGSFTTAALLLSSQWITIRPNLGGALFMRALAASPKGSSPSS